MTNSQSALHTERDFAWNEHVIGRTEQSEVKAGN